MKVAGINKKRLKLFGSKISRSYTFLLLIAIICSLIIYSCNTEKLELDKITNAVPTSINNLNDTVYIKQNPDWTGFNKPEDIIVGSEPFIYVADTYNDQVVMLNIAGQVLGRRTIKHPVAIAQDYKLNLIICAGFDTTIDGTQKSFSALYKLNLVAASHHLESAPITRLLPKTSMDLVKVNRTYTGVCVFYNNSFYVARTGPNNPPVDPDNAILMFEHKKTRNGEIDTLIGRVPLLEPEGSGLLSVNKVSSLSSFNKKNTDFILTLIGNNSFKTQWLQFIVSNEFTGYTSKLSPFSADLMKVNLFKQPEGTAIDNIGNIFVADAGKDSVFKFNSSGDELQSFGGPGVFNKPYAVAFFDRTVYVADRDNNRILRFILSTEIY
jgi:hypothetical protein